METEKTRTGFFCLVLFCFWGFFWPHLRHVEGPRPGIEPEPQQWQHQILNPLIHQGTHRTVFKGPKSRTQHREINMVACCYVRKYIHMDKEPAKMGSLSFMKAVNLGMAYSLLAFHNFCIMLSFKGYIIFEDVS